MEKYKHFDIESTYDSARHSEFTHQQGDIFSWWVYLPFIILLAMGIVVVSCM